MGQVCEQWKEGRAQRSFPGQAGRTASPCCFGLDDVMRTGEEAWLRQQAHGEMVRRQEVADGLSLQHATRLDSEPLGH
eukprot:747081-Hanusia_phi.AAC.1